MKRIIFLCAFIIFVFTTTFAQEEIVNSYTNDTTSADFKYHSGFMIKTLKELRKEIPILIDDIKKRKQDLQNDPYDVHLSGFIQAQEQKLLIMQRQLRLFSQIKGFDLSGKKIKLESNDE